MTNLDTTGSYQSKKEDKNRIANKPTESPKIPIEKKYDSFTVYLDEHNHLVAPCSECAEIHIIDDVEPDRDSGEFFCTPCLEKLQYEGEQELRQMHADYQRAVGF